MLPLDNVWAVSQSQCDVAKLNPIHIRGTIKYCKEKKRSIYSKSDIYLLDHFARLRSQRLYCLSGVDTPYAEAHKQVDYCIYKKKSNPKSRVSIAYNESVFSLSVGTRSYAKINLKLC